MPLTVVSSQESPNALSADYATPICFTAGTRIATPNGAKMVEELIAGDMVQTTEGGAELFALFPELERLSARSTSHPALRAVEARAALTA